MAKIQDLPVEILLKILEHVYHLLSLLNPTPETTAHTSSVTCALTKNRACRCGRSAAKRDAHDGEGMGLQYPVTALSVCQLWRNILRPNFIQFCVDKYSPAYMAEFEARIRHANIEFLLDILVVNKSDSEECAQKEKKIVRDVMATVAAVLPRCRTIVFKLIHGSSLPCIAQDFYGEAPDLLVLKLQCRIPSRNIESGFDAPLSSLFSSLKCPKLTVLALDGLTYANAFLVPSWTTQMQTLSLHTLSISNYGPVLHSHSHVYGMHFLLATIFSIAHIHHLILDNITMYTTEEAVTYRGDPGSALFNHAFNHPSLTSPLNGHYNDLSVDNLTITRPGNFLAQQEFFFWSHRSLFGYYHLSQAPIDHRSIPAVHHLRLEQIPTSGLFWHGFMTALNRFYGHRLDLIDCDDLCDQHLLQIETHCERMRWLYIEDCPNITVGGLKAMITARNTNLEDQADDEHLTGDSGGLDHEDNDDDNTKSLFEADLRANGEVERAYARYFSGSRDLLFVPICRLHISGNPNVLSHADERWFGKHVREFCWI